MRKLTARESAARRCCLSKQTKKTLELKLRGKGFSEEEIASSVKAMEENGYIDEDAYVRAFVKDSYTIKKHGHIRIINELVLRGISRTKAEEAVLDYAADERSIIREVMEKRFYKNYDNAKILRYFYSRGFEADDVRRCIDEYKSRNDIARMLEESDRF